MRSVVTALVAALLLAILVPVAAQALTVSTDKDVYMPGETVLVTGTTAPGAPVGIAAYNPKGTMVFFTMVTAGADGRYSASIRLPKVLPYEEWVYGTYTVEARVGATAATKSFTLAAASLVVGRVVDERGSPVANAEVLVVETGVSTLTGKDGSFALSTDVGTWTLRVSKAGYVGVERKVTTVVGTNDVGVVRITSLESLVAELSARVEALGREVGTLGGRVAALEAQIPVLAEISRKLDNVSASLAALSRTLGDLSTKVDALSRAVADVGARVSAVDTKVGDLTARMVGLEASVRDALGKVSDALGKVTGTLDALRVDITGMRADLKTVSDGVKAVSDGIKGLSTKSDVDAVGRRVDALSGAVGGLSGAVYAAVVLALLAFAMSLLVYMTVRKAITK